MIRLLFALLNQKMNGEAMKVSVYMLYDIINYTFVTENSHIMQMNLYTKFQKNLTLWNTKDAGYVIGGNAFSSDPGKWHSGNILIWLYLSSFVMSTLLTLFSIIAIVYIICKKTPKSSEKVEFKAWHSLFWTSVAVLFQCNSVLLTVDNVYAIILCSLRTGCSAVEGIKITWITFTIAASLAIAFASVIKVNCLPFDIPSMFSVPFLKVENEKLKLLLPPLISPLCYKLINYCCTCVEIHSDTFWLYCFTNILLLLNSAFLHTSCCRAVNSVSRSSFIYIQFACSYIDSVHSYCFLWGV